MGHGFTKKIEAFVPYVLYRLILVGALAIPFAGVGCQPAKSKQEREEKEAESAEAKKLKGLTQAQVRERLKTGTVFQRRAAVENLVEASAAAERDWELLRALLEATRDQDDEVRDRAFVAVQRQLNFGWLSKLVVPGARRPEKDGAAEVRCKVLDALTKLYTNDEDSLPLIMDATKDANSTVRMLAAGSLVRYKKQADQAIVGLQEAIKDPEPFVRQQAIWALSQHGQKSLVLEEQLLLALQDPDKGVRWEASVTLAAIDRNADKVVPAFLNAIEKEPFSDNREWLAKGLRAYPSASRDIVPVLVRYLAKDGAASVRAACAESLGSIKADPKSTVPALIVAARDPNDFVRSQAFRSLGSFGPQAIPIVVAGLNDEKTRAAAGIAVARFGPSAKAAIPELIKMLREENDHPQIALSALAAMGPEAKDAIPVLRKLREDGTLNPVSVEIALQKIDPDANQK